MYLFLSSTCFSRTEDKASVVGIEGWSTVATGEKILHSHVLRPKII